MPHRNLLVMESAYPHLFRVFSPSDELMGSECKSMYRYAPKFLMLSYILHLLVQISRKTVGFHLVHLCSAS